LPAHLRHCGEVLALPETQLLHQVLGDLRVLGARKEVAPDLPQERVRTLCLGVEHPFHRREVRLDLRRRRPRCTARSLGPGLRLLLLLLARLPLLQLLRGEEDLVLLSVRTGQHPVRLPLGGEEHRGAAASPAPAAATASRPRLAGCWGGSARRGAGAGRALVLLGAIVLRAVVSVGVGCLRSGRGGEGVQGVVVVAHVGPCESDASAGKRANTRSAPPMNIRSRSSAGQPGKWARPRRKSPPYSSSRSRVQEPSIGPFAAPPPGGGSGMHARWGFAPPGPRRRAWRFPAPCGGSGRSPDSGRGRARARGGARPRPPRCSRASRAGGTAVPTRRGPRAAPAGARRPRPS